MFSGFADEEYRHAYADEYLNTFIPLQIKAIREQRGWTQAELGRRFGGKAQAWISQLEDPNYARFSLATLRGLARVFDCVLEVRFRSFKDYSEDQSRRRPGDTRVNTYSDDAAMGGAAVTRTDDVVSASTEVITAATTGRFKMAKASIARDRMTIVEDDTAVPAAGR